MTPEPEPHPETALARSRLAEDGLTQDADGVRWYAEPDAPGDPPPAWRRAAGPRAG